MAAFPKPCATARKMKKLDDRSDLKRREDKEKQKARRRDGHRCRFPLCGCRRLGLRLEVSHQQHKGAGGNPAGDRSTAKGLITLCVHRHQTGSISRHKGTMRARPLTTKGMNGPVAWDLDLATCDDIMAKLTGGHLPGPKQKAWVEVASEIDVQKVALPTGWRLLVLEELAEMVL